MINNNDSSNSQNGNENADKNNQSIYDDPSLNNIGKGYYSDNKTQDDNPYRSTASSQSTQNQNNYNNNNNNNYQNNGYQNNGYQNNSYQNNGYQNNGSNQNYYNGNPNYNQGNPNYNNGNPNYNNGNPNFNQGNSYYNNGGNGNYNNGNYNYNNGNYNNAPYVNHANADNFTTYLILSVVVALFGSRILGVIAIILTCMGNNEFKAGNENGYHDKFKIAKILIIVGAIIGVFSILGYTFFHISTAFNLFNYL